MEQLEQIPIGQQANDGTGDPLRNGMAKVNANFTKVQTGVDAVELTAANAAQTATEAKTTADAAIPATQKGMAGGVAPLDASGKVPAAHLPVQGDYIAAEEKGAADGVAPLDAGTKVPVANLPVGTAGGVAPLGADGKVPAINLPAAEDSIPLSQKGQPGGVATLDTGGQVPSSQIPPLDYLPTIQKGVAGGVAALGSDGRVPDAQLPLDSQLGFAIAYPNGGSAAAPANITVNSRYVVANPFPGYRVLCQLEIRANGKWGSPGGGFIVNTSGQIMGCYASQYDDGDIVVQTAVTYLTSDSPAATGHPFQPNLSSFTTAPARVKVWRIRGQV
ncbi:hypothetical protein ACOTBX_24940 [Achromobacter xylosoxidans]